MIAAVRTELQRWTGAGATERRAAPAVPEPLPPRRWAPVLIGIAASAGGLALIIAVVIFHIAGTAVAGVVDATDQGLAALAAAVTCALLARRSSGKIRRGWLLIASSALITVVAGAAALGAYGLIAHRPVPFPSLADAFYLFGQGLAIAGILVFPASPSRTSSRGRVAIDGAVIAISLLFVAWALGLGVLYNSSSAPLLSKLVGLAYPAMDIVAVTVLLLTIRRAPRPKTARLSILLAGLVVKSVADSISALLSVNSGIQADIQIADIVWITGYVLIMVAALWPVRPAVVTVEEGPTSLWQMLMPWLGMVAVVLACFYLKITGLQIDSFLVYPGVALVILLMASQLISYRDSLGFLNRSRQAEASLKARTHLLNQVIAFAPLGIARIGGDSRFIDANPRLGSMLHAPMKILIGAHVSEFMTGETPPDTARNYAALLGGSVDSVDGGDREVTRTDGSTVWLHWTTTAVRKPDGGLDYVLAMAEDISARHEVEETSMATLAGLERLNQLKSEFVSMVSHEFRTALVGIQGFSELIRDENLGQAETKELAGDINNDAMRLNRLIGEMLDLDRMEAGKIRLDLKAINVNALLTSGVQHTQMTTDKHALVADLDLAAPLVSGDSDRLIQVITNLLSNAIKYSPDGGEIKVSSRVENGMVHVSVQDHGIGIPPEFIGHLFGRYERFDSNRASKVAGTGLGLAIALQIVELHGGKIWVESAAGSGSTFQFTIPVAVTSSASEPFYPGATRAA